MTVSPESPRKCGLNPEFTESVRNRTRLFELGGIGLACCEIGGIGVSLTHLQHFYLFRDHGVCLLASITAGYGSAPTGHMR